MATRRSTLIDQLDPGVRLENKGTPEDGRAVMSPGEEVHQEALEANILVRRTLTLCTLMNNLATKRMLTKATQSNT